MLSYSISVGVPIAKGLASWRKTPNFGTTKTRQFESFIRFCYFVTCLFVALVMNSKIGHLEKKFCIQQQWRIQKILVGGDLKHKTSKIRMSSPKLRVIFRPKSEIQTFFSPKIRWSPKKKKKKRSSPKLRLIFRPKSELQTFFSPKIRWFQKKKKRSSPKLRVIFRPKSEIQRFYSPKFRWSPKKKKKVFTKIETDFSPDSLRLGRWGGCIPKWSRIIRNRG